MATKKISALTAASTLDGAEQAEVVQSAASKRTTLQAIADLFGKVSGTQVLAVTAGFLEAFADAAAGLIASRYSGNSSAPVAILRKSRGTRASPSPVVTSDEAGRLAWQVNTETAGSATFGDVASDRASIVEGSPSNSARGGRRSFWVTPVGGSATTERLRLDDTGWQKDGGTVIVDASNGVRLPSYAATDIASIAHAVNTAAKGAGKMIWDSTNHRIMVAAGATAAALWWVADGSASVTPA